jgi:hypothetical protein
MELEHAANAAAGAAAAAAADLEEEDEDEKSPKRLAAEMTIDANLLKKISEFPCL